MYGRWEIAPNKLDGPENQSPAAPFTLASQFESTKRDFQIGRNKYSPSPNSVKITGKLC